MAHKQGYLYAVPDGYWPVDDDWANPDRPNRLELRVKLGCVRQDDPVNAVSTAYQRAHGHPQLW